MTAPAGEQPHRASPAAPRSAAATTGAVGLLLRLGVTAGLLVSAIVHWQLAEAIGLAAPGGIGGETLFRAQAITAAVVALAVLATGRWWAYAGAFVVAGASLVAVLASTWFAIPAIGPIPSMYDPMWYPAKTASAVAEGVAALLAAVALVLIRRRGGGRAASRGG